MKPAPSTHRLFFALWPSDALREEIMRNTRAWSAMIDGRAIAPANLHVTLKFLGSVPDSTVEGLRSVAAGIRARRFELQFDRLEVWSRAKVLVLGASRTPDELLALVDALQISSLPAEASAHAEEYRPHVTLARDVGSFSHALASPSTVNWSARDFALVESISTTIGSIYRVIGRWPLA
jgi:2'-5' RNA ligase